MTIHSIHAAFIVLIYSSGPPPHSVGLNSLMAADTGTCSYCMVGDVVFVVCVPGLDARVIVIDPSGVCWATPLSTSAMVARTRPMMVPMQGEWLMTGYISEPLMSPLKSQVFWVPKKFLSRTCFLCNLLPYRLPFMPQCPHTYQSY